jgi:ATP-dependent Clp protease ATP-binding subunit ClpA
MFERFTKPARAVVASAHEESAALGGDRIAAEHLLVALAGTDGGAASGALAGLGLTAAVLRDDVRATGGLDADALASIGIDLEAVRRRVEDHFGPGALGRGRGGRKPFTRAAKKALELSLREALARGDRSIGPEHILLGVVRDPGDGVAALLRRRGRTPEEIRGALSAALRDAA